MTTATVASKGRITIPVEVREQLGLRTGSRVAFVRTADGTYEIRPQTGSVQDLKGVVAAPAQPISLAEMRASSVW